MRIKEEVEQHLQMVFQFAFIGREIRMAPRVQPDGLPVLVSHIDRSNQRIDVHQVDNFLQDRESLVIGINGPPPRIPYHDETVFLLGSDVKVIPLVLKSDLPFFVFFGLASYLFQDIDHQVLCTDFVQFIFGHLVQMLHPLAALVHKTQEEQYDRPQCQCNDGYQDGNVGNVVHKPVNLKLTHLKIRIILI